MKYPIFLLAFVLFYMSCKTEVPREYALVTGKVTNSPGQVVLGAMDRSFSIPIPTDNEGLFLDTLRTGFGHYMFYDGRNFTPIYVGKGDSIYISYDANDFKNTLAFSGEGSQISAYLQDKSKLERELLRSNGNVYTLDENEFKTVYGHIRDSLMANVASISSLPNDYREKEERNIKYNYLAQLHMYKPYHSYYTGNPDFEVSDDFMNELDGLDVNNEEDFKFSMSYVNLLGAHYNKMATALAKSDSIAEYIAFNKLVSNAKSDLIKNTLLYKNAKAGITYTDDLTGYYKSFMEHSTDNAHKTEITETYDRLKVLDKGEPSPEFIDYENYQGGTMSLTDLKGKYVYIDVWATWCGPCKKEIPFLKEVEEKYHDKNIAFVSISIDKASDHDKWKTMVAEKELGGIQLFADKDWNSDFVKNYQISGIPRFILINPEGQIISANAPRPSDPKLIDLLREYDI
ncbi:redoxin family protein [Aestuariivivens sediminis]|uniref:redoxin family protein n=1 Tax=Aestuariivivens sediminis TaxID=2913557 RepID=UPI001F5657F7|nr:thioredoxin-like domain-containing protein [Aestuariivivens sediminis]